MEFDQKGRRIVKLCKIFQDKFISVQVFRQTVPRSSEWKRRGRQRPQLILDGWMAPNLDERAAARLQLAAAQFNPPEDGSIKSSYAAIYQRPRRCAL